MSLDKWAVVVLTCAIATRAGCRGVAPPTEVSARSPETLYRSP